MSATKRSPHSFIDVDVKDEDDEDDDCFVVCLSVCLMDFEKYFLPYKATLVMLKAGRLVVLLKLLLMMLMTTQGLMMEMTVTTMMIIMKNVNWSKMQLRSKSTCRHNKNFRLFFVCSLSINWQRRWHCVNYFIDVQSQEINQQQ